MADAGIGEAILLSEMLGESYAVPGIMEGAGAMLGESYAVPGILPGTSSLLGGTSPFAMFGADMASAGYPAMIDMLGESYAVPGMLDTAGTIPGGAFDLGGAGYDTEAFKRPSNWYDMFFKAGGPDTGGIKDFWKSMNMAGQLGTSALGGTLAKQLLFPKVKVPGPQPYTGPLSKFRYNPDTYTPYTPAPPMPAYRAQYAGGGITALAQGGLNNPTGPVERLSQQVVGAGGMYPQSQMDKTYFATPTQMPASAEVIGADYDARTNPYTGVMMASGGLAQLGDIDDLIEEAQTTSGGIAALTAKARKDNPNALAAISKMEQEKMLKQQHNAKLAGGGIASLKEGSFVVPADVVSHMGNGSTDAGIAALRKHTGAKPIRGGGDGMSDSIPTSIEGKQQARIADGEAVIEPEQVKRIGKGSSKDGAKKLYSMMDKVRKARTGSAKQGRQINPAKYMPA